MVDCWCRNRMRQYPALVNCTTIDWFSEWPADALLEVADKYLEQTEMATEEEVTPLILLSHRLLWSVSCFKPLTPTVAICIQL